MTRLLLGLAMVVALAGCGSTARSPYLSDATANRDTVKAEAFYQQAKAVLTEDPAKAEALLRQSLASDIFHGGAHNNLGVLLLKQDKLYDAAEEFEWARKLLPGHAEPRVNLALVLDRAGQHDEALLSARAALEVMPGNLAAMEMTASIQLGAGLADEKTPVLLAQIAQRAPEPWRSWAVDQGERLRSADRQSQP